ncbi:MAG: pyridoxamine 5'-phosphate oxidase family protein [Bacilli bacterium]|nr:pyridoxamine 5'-phosphate oxidase family protein [Bacilli bacterium]
MENLERIYKFLEEAGTYYLATVEGDQPRVRAFGTALLYEGKLYIQTGKIKAVSKQIKANPKVEICAFKDGSWIRLSGILQEDDRREVKKAMLDKMPTLRAMYSEDDGNTEMLYFKSGEATFSSFVAPSETVTF